MTKSARESVVVFGSIVGALVVANVLGDLLRLARFVDLRTAAVAIVVVATLGAACGAAFARVRAVASGRVAAIGALSASLTAFLVLRLPSPWIDLGPFGAGPLTTLALVVLPLAQVAAILGVRRWSDR